jgi:hypothetical protein
LCGKIWRTWRWLAIKNSCLISRSKWWDTVRRCLGSSSAYSWNCVKLSNWSKYSPQYSHSRWWNDFIVFYSFWLINWFKTHKECDDMIEDDESGRQLSGKHECSYISFWIQMAI